MKCFKFLMAAMIAVVIASCGSSGYDEKKCDELARKVSKKEKLTQSDYAAMIEQVECMDNEFIEIKRSVGDSQEEREKLLRDRRVSDMLGYTMVFNTVLAFTDELDADNTEAWDRLQRKFEARDN